MDINQIVVSNIQYCFNLLDHYTFMLDQPSRKALKTDFIMLWNMFLHVFILLLSNNWTCIPCSWPAICKPKCCVVSCQVAVLF